MSCAAESTGNSEIKTTELKDFELFVSLESNTLAIPNIIKYDKNLFVYDIGHGKIIEIGQDKKVVREFGRAGRGPGEFLLVNNIFLTEDHLYIVDNVQLLTHKYHKNGELQSSFDFGKITKQPIAPPPPAGLMAMEIDNQPFISLQGDIMLSTVNVGTTDGNIFELLNWEGDKLSELGEVPEGSTFDLDYVKLRQDVSQREIPSFYRSNSFPVSDYANPDEFFVVYSSLPKIAKYKADGEKIWEHEIKSTETDSISNRFFEVMDDMRKSSDIRDRIDLEYYTSGISGENGDIYLVVNSRPVVVHQFSGTGELIHKYKFTSEEITPILDFDFANKRVFAVTKEGEVRTYSF
ncbi:MAG: hypothetical protein WD158_00425 [Balneolaceae bacterium]